MNSIRHFFKFFQKILLKTYLTEVLRQGQRKRGYHSWNFLMTISPWKGSMVTIKIIGYSMVLGFWILRSEGQNIFSRLLRILRTGFFQGEVVIFLTQYRLTKCALGNSRGGHSDKKNSFDPVFCHFWAKNADFCQNHPLRAPEIDQGQLAK